ncbi:alpha-2-macroglobulin domain protein [Geotalea daltonii FRC-32]|uniref:Alpha-2-macroglobulin domain protein n=1 Tax=Geotalea daltonii (strain DSM 22248 / JCM 15807 / FRC-32) TaxID=316067 RepID=B9M5P9_GEODF|nr:carboxypeptidase regulatory-like domain-containing protein [Geotalea daltonii]ACM21808.1 alpha-2-macroglobulin domain protein [Geotalea daltonii FRC-32]
MLNRNLIIIVAIVFNLATFAHAQLPQIAGGLTFLTASQNPDGTWNTSTSEVETTAATVSVLETLKLLNQTASTSYTTGTSWLQALSPQPVDYIAERLRTLGLSDVTSLTPSVDGIKGGWGGDAGYETTLLDTAKALQALKSANYTDPTIINPALAYLTSSQNADGGWGFYAGDSSNVYMTAVVSATLQQFPQMTIIANAVAKATAFLIAHQNSDGGFGSSPSTVYETALAYVALAAVSNDATILGNAVNYLTTTQSANGSWNDDPYSTALALKALYFSENKPSPPPAPPLGATITGTVIDAVTKRPVSGVAVAIDGNTLFAATTDATGSFALADVPTGTQKLTFTLSGYAANSASTTAVAGATSSLGTISLLSAYSTGTIAGTVTDPTGKPLAGVAITVSGAWSGTATTGADGGFTFTYVTPGDVTITAEKAGYQALTSTGTVYARTTLTFSPRLSTSPPTATTGTLVGRVVDSFWGRPIGHLPEETGVQVIVSGGTSVSVEPEGGGYFTIANLQPGTYQVVVGMHGFASHTFRVVISAGTTTDLGTIRLEMSFLMTLTGKVTDAKSGLPIPGAEVMVQPGNLTSRTDFAGTYAIADINDAEITVKAFSVGYVGKSYTVGKQPWLQTMDIALTPLVTNGGISGTVVDAVTSLPLAGVALSLTNDPKVSTVTNSTGTFALNGIHYGMQQITVALDGYTPRTLKTYITAGATTNAGTIVLSTGTVSASVQGVVRNAGSDAPFAGAVMETATGNTTLKAATLAGGTYAITDITPGDVTISAGAEGYFSARIGSTLAPGETFIFSPALAMMITPSADMTVKVDQALYKSGETVPVTVNIHNKQSLDLSPLLHVRVLDPYVAKVFDTTVSLSLAADGDVAQTVSFVMPQNAVSGNYLIQAELYSEAGNIMQTASNSFGSAVSEVSISPTLPTTFSTTNTVTFNLTNTGTIPVSSGVLAVTLKDPDGQVAYSSSQALSLALAESKMLTYNVSTAVLKLGTYTLSYILSDETRTIKPVEVVLTNTVDINASFDKSTYRIREAGNLTVVITNTGKFSLDTGLTATVSIPDATYTETKFLPAGISASGTAVIYSFPVPETVNAGLHPATVTLRLPSGSEVTEKAFWAVPESSLTSTVAKTAYSAGNTITVVIANTGGIDTPVDYQASLYDAKATLIAEKSATEIAVAGSSIPLGLPIPVGAVDGTYTLNVQFKDGKTTVEKIVPYALSIAGIKASLQMQTDKEVYLATENITGLGAITNTGTPLQGGNVHLQVVTGPGSYKQKTWITQADFQTGVRNGVDTYGVNDWIIPDDDFDDDRIDTGKWVEDNYGTSKQQESTGVLIQSAGPGAGYASLVGNASSQLQGDFDVQVDFSLVNPSSGEFWALLRIEAANREFRVERKISYGQNVYSADYWNGSSWNHSPNLSTTDSSGKLRITRNGTTAIAYCWENGAWKQLWSTNIWDGPLNVRLWTTNNGYNNPVETHWDNFKISSGRIMTVNQTVDSARLLPLNDNFDDGVLNEDRWRSAGVYLPTEANGLMHQKSDGNGATSVFLKASLPGDFAAIEKYKNAKFTVVRSHPEGDIGHYLTAKTGPSSGFWLYETNIYPSKLPQLQANSYINSNWWASSVPPSNWVSGYFKLRRTGTSAYAEYWDGAMWSTYHLKSGMETGPATIRILTTNADTLLDESASVDVDAFYTENGVYASAGVVTLKQDSGAANTSWGKINFNTTQPTGTSIKFRTRTADTEAGLTTAIWSDYITASGSPITNPAARWIEVEATLATTDTNVTPLLNDLTVTYLADPGEVLWQTDVPVDLAPVAVADLNKTIGTLGVLGKLYFQGTLTSSTGQAVASAEYPFYIEQGNFQLLLSPDKKIYKPGETVTISGEVRNITSLAAALALQVKDNQGATLYTDTFDIAANGSRPFSFTTTAGSDGIYTLKGAVTQNSVIIADITEQYEASSPMVTAALTAPDSAGADPFQVSLVLTNSGKIEAVIAVAKSFDTTAETITIPAGETRSVQYTQQIAADTTYTFTITGDLSRTLTKTVAYTAPPIAASVTGKIVTDKIAYNPNDQANLTGTLTANTYMENLSLLVTITNSQGQALYTDTTSIPQLNQGQTTTINKYWNVGANPAATYLVTMQILNNTGTVITKSTCNLVIGSITKPTALLKGQVTLDKQSILTGEPVAVSYTVTNIGNTDLVNIPLSVQTINISDQTTYNPIPDTASLAMGQIHSGTGQIDTQNYGAKDYLVILRATIDGVEETLAGTYFRVEGAPSAPALVSPISGADVETLTPQLTVSNAADPNDDRLTYQFEVYTDSGLTNLAASGQAPETANMTIWTPAALIENQTYYWRSRAFDGKLYGPWMPAVSFRVNTINDPPTAPTVSAPADGTAVALSSPTLTINNSSDPDSTSLTYNFAVALDPEFTNIIASTPGVASGEATTSWTVPVTLQENGWYHWRAQADDWQMEGPWSQTVRFQVNTANDAPTTPVITAPLNGSTVAALTTHVVVTNSTDPDSSVITYFFEADTVPTFDSPNIVRSGSIPQGEGSTTWNLSGLSDNTRYYLRAKASDGAAESTWSETISFFANTVNDPPTTPTPANPSDGAGVNQYSPTLSVHNAADLDHDPLTYEFEVYADAALTSLVSRAAGVIETAAVTSWTVPVTLTENQTYYWRARAFDGYLTSDKWTQAMSFMVNTANDAPGAPKPALPAEGSSVSTPTPTLTIANAADPDSSIQGYDFEIYAGPTLAATVTGIPQDASGMTSVTLNTPLTDNTAYQWRARAFDGALYGAWSHMASFTVHLPVTSIGATIDFDPDTLNPKSNGTWVTVRIELPEGYNPSDIDIASIRLEGAISAELRPYAVGDCDKDGIKDLMVKFRRSEVINLLPSGDRVPVHVTGKVGSVVFEGVDLIRVMQ